MFTLARSTLPPITSWLCLTVNTCNSNSRQRFVFGDCFTNTPPVLPLLTNPPKRNYRSLTLRDSSLLDISIHDQLVAETLASGIPDEELVDGVEKQLNTSYPDQPQN